MSDKKDKLVILWSGKDRGVALQMIFPYALNSKKYDWWDEVNLIVWGSSAELLSADEEMREEIVKLKDSGVVLEACKACADNLGVTEELEDLGIDVYYIGEQFTEYLKEGRTILTL